MPGGSGHEVEGLEEVLEEGEREIGFEFDQAVLLVELEAVEEVFLFALEGEAEEALGAAEGFGEFLRIGGGFAGGLGMEGGAGGHVEPGREVPQRERQALDAGDAAFGKAGGQGGEVEVTGSGEGADEVDQVAGDAVAEFAIVDDGAERGSGAGDGDAGIEKGDGEGFLADEGEALVGELLGAFEAELGLKAGIGDAAVDKFAANEGGAGLAAKAVDHFVHALGEVNAGLSAELFEGDGAIAGEEGVPGGSLAQVVETDAGEGGGVGGDEGGESRVNPLLGDGAGTGSQEGGEQEGTP